jgi:hypothetical protein
VRAKGRIHERLEGERQFVGIVPQGKRLILLILIRENLLMERTVLQPRHLRSVAMFAALALVTLGSAARGAILINDDFSTFANGNLIGAPNAAGGWIQSGAAATLPFQVSGGKVVIPGAQSTDNQDAFKTFGSVFTAPGSGSLSLYAGLGLKVNSAPVINSTPFASASYFFALDNAANGTGFDNERVAVVDNSVNVPNTYLLQARVTGQAGSPFVTGTTPLTYGTSYNVVVEATLTSIGTNEAITLYVNPTSGDQGAQTPYLISPIAGGTPLTGIGGVVLSQFASATVGNGGVEIGSLRAATTFAEASNLAVPEPSSAILAGLSALLIAMVAKLRRRK